MRAYFSVCFYGSYIAKIATKKNYLESVHIFQGRNMLEIAIDQFSQSFGTSLNWGSTVKGNYWAFSTLSKTATLSIVIFVSHNKQVYVLIWFYLKVITKLKSLMSSKFLHAGFVFLALRFAYIFSLKGKIDNKLAV